MGLSAMSQAALDLLRERTVRNSGDEWAAITAEATTHDAADLWINFGTARALERRGLVEIDWDRLRLTEKGWRA